MQPEVFGGRYHVVRPIGRGGMGTVWLCRDDTLAREVAVKQVGRLPGDPDTDTARAIREARSTAALNHRNVVTVFDVLREDGGIWMVMEHVPSRSLSQVLRDEGRLSPSDTAALGAQVADGLAAAHAAGIVHRDVKPGNVLVTDEGVAKIGDFGISRTAGEPALTQSGLLTGTPSYFSPELARGADAAPAADVWALGATLYAAVEGRPPYEPRDNPVAVLHEITSRTPAEPRRAGPLAPVLARMLDPDPATRWSMDDAAHALHRIADRERDRTTALTTAAPAAPTSASGRGFSLDEPHASTLVGDRPPTDRPTRGEVRSTSAPKRDGRGSKLLLTGLVALALAVAAIFLLDRVNLTDGSGPQAAPTAGEQPSENGSRTDQSDEGAGQDESRDTGRGDGSGSGQAPAQATSDDAAAFVDGYFDTVPTDLDTGWTMLSPDYQAETGRSTYDGFWNTVDSVDATHISPTRDGNTVKATVTYTYDDGRTVTERQRIRLVESPDGPLIDGYETI